MTNLPEKTPWFLRLVLAGLLVLLSACGPGVGGTGTGPTAGGGNLPAQPPPPIIVTAFDRVCLTACDAAVLDLGTQNVTLATGCRTFIAIGSWMGQSPLVIEGALQTVAAGGTTTVAATLRVEFNTPASGPQRASMEIRDSANQLLLGPLELQRNDAAVVPPATTCP